MLGNTFRVAGTAILPTATAQMILESVGSQQHNNETMKGLLPFYTFKSPTEAFSRENIGVHSWLIFVIFARSNQATAVSKQGFIIPLTIPSPTKVARAILGLNPGPLATIGIRDAKGQSLYLSARKYSTNPYYRDFLNIMAYPLFFFSCLVLNTSEKDFECMCAFMGIMNAEVVNFFTSNACFNPRSTYGKDQPKLLNRILVHL